MMQGVLASRWSLNMILGHFVTSIVQPQRNNSPVKVSSARVNDECGMVLSASRVLS